MTRPLLYLLVPLVVLAVNLLPAFGPPTWALLVYARLRWSLDPFLLVLLGAPAAAAGRLVLGLVCRRLSGRFTAERRAHLEALGAKVLRDGRRTRAGLVLFALSPVPSAQLFEAAGLLRLALVPFTAAFFLGRLVSYSLYLGGAVAVRRTSAGHLVTESFTSPWSVVIQVALLVALVALVRTAHIIRH